MARHMRSQHGVSLVEVLVAMVILSVGLLGLVVLHGRLHVLQMESYQRSQALILLQDMSSRIVLNRNNAAAYVTVAPLGVGTPARRRTRRARSGHQRMVQGAAGCGRNDRREQVGAMVGGRGCVENIGGGEYLVTVAWQGMAPLRRRRRASPAAGPLRRAGRLALPDDLCRRVVTTVVRIATLT